MNISSISQDNFKDVTNAGDLYHTPVGTKISDHNISNPWLKPSLNFLLKHPKSYRSHHQSVNHCSNHQVLSNQTSNSDNHGHQSLEITSPQQPGHIERMHVQKAHNLSHVYHPTPNIVEAPITSANASRTPDVHFSFQGLSFPVTGSSFLDGSPHHSRSIVRAPIGKGDLLTPYKIQSDSGHLSYANERSVQPLYQPQSDYFPLFNTSRQKQQPHKKQDYWNEMSQHEYRLQGQTIPHTSKLDDHLYDGMNFTTNTCKSAQKRDQDRGNNQNQMENSRYLPGYYVDLVGTNPITYIRPAPINNVNTVTSMQTSCVEQQPSDNVRMFMDIESRGLLQCDTDARDTRKEESNNMQRNASHLSNVCQSKLPVSIEMNNNLKSDSTFSIECQVMGERMVSALCTTPVKDKEEGLDFQNEKDLHVKNWLNNISFDGMSPNTDASYTMDVKEEDCVSDSSTVCVPVLIRNRDLTKRYLIPHSFYSRSDWSCETASPMYKNNDAVQSTKRTYCNARKGERISPTSGTQSNETVIDFENNNYLYYVENFCSYLNESVPKLYPQVDINYIHTLCEEFSKKGSTFHSSDNSRFGSIDDSQAQICEDLYFSSLMMIQCWMKLRSTFKSQNVDCQFQSFTPEIKHSFGLLQANIFQMLQHICSYIEMLNENEIKLKNFKVSDNYSKIKYNLKNDTQSASPVCMNSANNLSDKQFPQPRGQSNPLTSLYPGTIPIQDTLLVSSSNTCQHSFDGGNNLFPSSSVPQIFKTGKPLRYSISRLENLNFRNISKQKDNVSKKYINNSKWNASPKSSQCSTTQRSLYIEQTDNQHIHNVNTQDIFSTQCNFPVLTNKVSHKKQTTQNSYINTRGKEETNLKYKLLKKYEKLPKNTPMSDFNTTSGTKCPDNTLKHNNMTICLNKAESAPALYQDVAHFPNQDSYKDNAVETNANHDNITKTTAAIQILPPHNNRRVPLTSVQRTVVAYDEDAVMVPMHVGTVPPQSDGLYNNSLSVVEDSTPAMSKITYMDLQPSPKPDLRTELLDDDLDGNYIQKGTYNPPSKSSMSKSTSVLTSKSSNCASVPDSFNSVQETNPSENIVRLRKDYHSPDANTIHFSMYNMYNTTKTVSDTTWKKAVAKVDTVKDPIETLVKSLQRESLNDSQDKEVSKINKEYKVDQDQSLEKKSSSSNDVSPEEKRKCEPIKTDNWLIKTLANASKLHGDSCLKNSENLYGSQIINTSNTKGDTVEEESQILESDLTCNEMIPADPRVLVTPIESTSSGRKVSREKKKNSTNKQGEETLVWTPVEKRGLCGARKRRFRDRAAERMVAEIDEEDESRTAVVGKGYAREKERWGIWCSSRRRRGLSKMARDKLEAILNMIWNMEEAEFIKYAVDSTSTPDYYLIVKHPMDLSDIARKLRNIIYETIEQFVHDFRLIFYNIRLYNEKESVYYKKGATLSQRFDELLEDNFTGWEFKSITGSPRELNTNPTLRYAAFDDHRKSTAKPLLQQNSQGNSCEKKSS